MKKPVFISIAALGLAALACAPITVNIPTISTGPTESLRVDEPLPDTDEVVDVEVQMGASELNLSGGAAGLAEGEIRYNVADWEPTITNTGSSLRIEQGDTEFHGIPNDDVINKWDLKLGDAPMNLTIRAGAYAGNLDLSGLPIQNLSIDDGASSSEVSFDSLNPEVMERFEYSSGASSVTLMGLANANFEELDFNGGAGDYTLDFSGELQRDAEVTVDGGVGSIRIIVPEEAEVRVIVDRGVGSVDTDSGWSQNGDEYTITGSGPKLIIHVKLGVGSLELVSK